MLAEWVDPYVPDPVFHLSIRHMLNPRARKVREDLDWHVCLRIRIWEQELYRYLREEEGREPVYAFLDVNRWRAICDEVEAVAADWLTREFGDLRRGMLADKIMWRYWDFFIDVVVDACASQYLDLLSELETMRLTAFKDIQGSGGDRQMER